MNVQTNKWYDVITVLPEHTNLTIIQEELAPYKELDYYFVVVLLDNTVCIAARISYNNDFWEWNLVENKYCRDDEVEQLSVKYWMAIQIPK